MNKLIYSAIIFLQIAPNWILCFLLPLRWIHHFQKNGKALFIVSQTFMALFRCILYTGAIEKGIWWAPIAIVVITFVIQAILLVFSYDSYEEFVDGYIFYSLLNGILSSPFLSLISARIGNFTIPMAHPLTDIIGIIGCGLMACAANLIPVPVMDFFLPKIHSLPARKRGHFRGISVVCYCSIFLISMFSVLMNGGNPTVDVGTVMALCFPILILMIGCGLYYYWTMIHEKQLSNQTLMELTNKELLLEKKNQEKVADYLRETEETLRNIQKKLENDTWMPEVDKISLDRKLVQRYADNEIADIVLSFFADQCETQGIRFSVSGMIPKELGESRSMVELQEQQISEGELTTVLYNLLSNAMEGTAKDNPWITICFAYQSNCLLIQVKNSYDREIARDNSNPIGRLLSSKQMPEEHGYGTRILKKIAEKYEGEFNLNFEKEEAVVEAMFLLPIPCENVDGV